MPLGLTDLPDADIKKLFRRSQTINTCGIIWLIVGVALLFFNLVALAGGGPAAIIGIPICAFFLVSSSCAFNRKLRGICMLACLPTAIIYPPVGLLVSIIGFLALLNGRMLFGNGAISHGDLRDHVKRRGLGWFGAFRS